MYKGSEVFMSKGILTKREKEVFSLLVDNKSTKEIADILNISEKTVRNHISNTMQKLSVKGRAQAIWFTNLEIDKRHEDLDLYKTYTPEEYPKYDNYDAINVNKTKDIPKDYAGAMGVPITFLDKYNPEQFEIISSNDYRINETIPFKEHGLIKDKDGAINGKPTYARILIKNKKL